MKVHPDVLKRFVAESNKIEGITREPYPQELAASEEFLRLEKPSANALQEFVAVCQPHAVLRDRVGLNVYIGNHLPPSGGPDIKNQLVTITMKVNLREHPYKIHLEYETLHPFTDCNGRSGRILWAWQMLNQYRDREWGADLSCGFLHPFYYQSLSHSRK